MDRFESLKQRRERWNCTLIALAGLIPLATATLLKLAGLRQ
jgi:NhaP-type Na+/H+ or K+/H+ antiporter